MQSVINKSDKWIGNTVVLHWPINFLIGFNGFVYDIRYTLALVGLCDTVGKCLCFTEWVGGLEWDVINM